MLTRTIIITVGKICFVFAGIFLSSVFAMAQHQCPNGPGPGETIAYRSPDGNGVAGIYFCWSAPQSSQSQYTTYTPPPPPTPQLNIGNGFYNFAWHPNSVWVWVATGFRNGDDASRTALTACNKSMGSGCSLVLNRALNYGAYVMGIDDDGELRAAGGSDRAEADKNLKKYCEEANKQCRVISFAEPLPTSQLADNKLINAPENDDHKKIGTYASASWVSNLKNNSKWTNSVFISSGRSSREEAIKDSLSQCEKTSGEKCNTVLTISVMSIVVLADKNNKVMVLSDSYKEAEDSLAKCKKAISQSCIVTGVFRAPTKGDFVLDPIKEFAKKTINK